MNKKKIVLINLVTVAIIAITLLITQTNPFSLTMTGYTFADFYGQEVMYTLNAIEGETTTFVVPIINQNEETLNEVTATITIKNIEGEIINILTTDTKEVNGNNRTELTTTWKNNLSQGTYLAEIYITSEKEDASFTKTFDINKRTIIIENIQVNEFELGERVNLTILVQNYMESDVTDATANMLIYSNSNAIITNIQSEKQRINRTSLNKINLEWDTSTIAPGTYNAKILINSKDHKSERDIVFNLGQNSFSVTGIGFAVNYAPVNNNETIWVIAIIIAGIILVNIIFWKVYLKKAKEKKNSN